MTPQAMGDLLSAGAALLGQLGQVCRSAGDGQARSGVRLTGLLGRDESSGRPYLKLPLPEGDAAERVLDLLGIKLAVRKGPAGPATAITGSNAILVTLLDLLVFRHWPPRAKVVGMILALAGIAILAVGGQRILGDEKPRRPPPE